jgi:hypothetical protein
LGSARATADASPLLPALHANDTTTIALEGQSEAVLLVPVGATSPQRLVALLLPPAKSLAEPCEAMGASIRRHAFVLCQPATSAQQSLVSVDAASDLVGSALRASLRVVRARFSRYLVPGAIGFGGVGEAAAMVAPIVRRNPEVFSRVVLIDGGFAAWTAVDSARFAKAGGIAFGAWCTEESCRVEASRVIATLKALGLATSLHDPGAADRAVAGAASYKQSPSSLLDFVLSVEVMGGPQHAPRP